MIENVFKEIVSKAIKENNEAFISILQEIKKASKIKEVTINHKGERYVSKETAGFLIDVSKSWIDKAVESGKLKKYYLDGNKTPRYKESEVLELVKDKPSQPENRKPKRITKKGVRLNQSV